MSNTQKNKILIFAGFLWGLSGFAVELIPGENFQQYIMRLIPILISGSIIIITFPIKFRISHFIPLISIGFYLSFFSLSIILNNSSAIYLVREVILIFSSALIYIIITDDDSNLTIFIRGIYYSLNLLCVFYFLHINFRELFSLLYRLKTNLNPNGIGSFSVMLFALGLFYLYKGTDVRHRILPSLSIIISVFVTIATRSRTSMAMLIIAYFLINLKFKFNKTLLFSLIIIAGIVSYNLQEFETIIRLKMPENISQKKNIGNLTGRTEVWKKGIKLIQDNFLLGVGPDRAVVKIDNHMGSFHNALIQLFVTTGLLGFLPILILLIYAFWGLIKNWHNTLIVTIFIIGVMGSMTESRLLNFGSPGNFLFLISILYLSSTSINQRLYFTD